TTTFLLSSTENSTAKFYSDAAGEDEIVTPITVNPGTDIGIETPAYSFYYSNTKTGSQTITAEYDDGDAGLAVAGEWNYVHSVVPGAVSGSHTTAVVPDGVAGEATEITVTARDAQGNPVGAGGSTVAATVAGSNAGLPVVVTDYRAGTYSLTYTPASSGDDEIGIRL